MDWVESSLEIEHLNFAPITPKIAIQSIRLAGTIHGDSADKILIATSLEHHAILVTHDQKILEYGKGKLLNVLGPC